MAAITRLLTLEEAARRLGIRPSTLIRYAETGRIKVFVELPMEEQQLPPLPPDDGPDEPVSIREASRRYGVPHPLLSRWTRWGLIRAYGRRGKELLISSRDAERLAWVYHSVRQQGGFKGRRIRRILKEWGMLPG